MKRTFLICMVIACSVAAANAQKLQGQARVDSLIEVLAVQTDDTNKVNTLLSIGSYYTRRDSSLSLKYLNEAYLLSKKIDWEAGQVNSMLHIGNTYGRNGDLATGLQYNQRALVLAESTDDKQSLAYCYKNLAYCYYHMNDYPTTLRYLQQAGKLFIELNNKEAIGSVYNRMANTYLHTGDYPKALENYLIALKAKEEVGDEGSTAGTISNIGVLYRFINEERKALEYFKKGLALNLKKGEREDAANDYTNIGTSYNRLGNLSQAIKNHTQALEIFTEFKNIEGQLVCNTNIAKAYEDHGNIGMAEKYYKTALGLTNDVDDKLHTAGVFSVVGQFYTKQGKKVLAEKYLQKALALTKEAGLIDNISNNYQNLYNLYKKYGEAGKALAAYEQHIIFRDSVFNQQNTKEITRLEVQSEYEKQMFADSVKNEEQKRAANAKLQKQKLFTFSGIGIALILVVFSFFIVKERKKSDKLLLNILPSEVAKELKAKGESDARMFDNVTVLFTDFVGFTTASERLTPQELVTELDICFKAFDGIIGKYGIEKIKTIGDAYLAVCGLPLADERHAEHVVNAAKDIIGFMADRRKKQGDKTFEIRIGVHSGEVVAGIVGVKKFAYDIWGDTVNTAARMEQNSEAGKINISQTTYELVQNKFTCTYRGELEAKNKGKLKMYFVEG